MRALSIVLALGALLPACKGSDTSNPPAAPQGRDGAPAVDETRAFDKAQSIASVLPADTVGLAVSADPADLFKRMGRDAVVKAIPELYNQAASEVRKELGFDLLDPANWGEIGIDPHGPGGFFVVGSEIGLGAFATLTDGAKLVAFLKKVTEDHMVVKTVGDAQVLSVGRNEPALVVRGKLVMLVTSRRSAWTAAWAAELATVTPDKSLHANPEYTTALGALKFGREGGGYLHVPRLVDVVLAEEMGLSDTPRLERFIDAARQRGDTELMASLESLRGNGRDPSSEEKIAVAAIKGLLFGGLGPMVGGLRVEDDVVRLRLKMPMGEGALLRRVAAQGGAANPIATLAGTNFMFLLGGNVRVDVLMATLRAVALAVGEADDFERDLNQVRENLGIALEDDLLKTLSGEAGFALLDQDPVAKNAERMGLTGFVGVSDEARLKNTFATLAKHPLLASLITVSDTGYTVKTDWRPLTVVTGPRLLVTTDAAAVKRMPGTQAPEGLAPALAELLHAQGNVAVFALDVARTALLTLLSRSDYEPPAPSTRTQSPEIEAKIKEWTAVQAEMTRTSAAREARQTAGVQRMLHPLGHLAATMKLTPEGVEIEAGQFIRGTTVVQAVATLAKEAATLNQQNRDEWSKSEDLYRKLSEIRTQIEQLDEGAMPVPVAPPGEAPQPGELVPAQPEDDDSKMGDDNVEVPKVVPDDGKME